jgi:drug/metabolite transporter (DMT)-like permease
MKDLIGGLILAFIGIVLISLYPTATQAFFHNSLIMAVLVAMVAMLYYAVRCTLKMLALCRSATRYCLTSRK